VIQGPGYSWSDLYVHRHVTFFKFHIDVPPTVNAFYWLLIDAIIFLGTLGVVRKRWSSRAGLKAVN